MEKHIKEKLLDFVLNGVSKYTGLPIHSIVSKNHGNEFVKARQLFCYTIDAIKQHDKKKYKITLKDIGDKLNIDHTTVLYSIKTVNDISETNKLYAEYVLEFIEIIINNLKSSKIEEITQQVHSYLTSAIIVTNISKGKETNQDAIDKALHIIDEEDIKYNPETQEKFNKLYDTIEQSSLYKTPSLLELFLLHKSGDEFAIDILDILKIEL